MCHWNVFLAIVLAALSQTINTQSSPNTTALAPTDLATGTPFSPSPGSVPDSAPRTSASTSLNSSTSPPTLDSTPSDPPTSLIPTSELSRSSTIPSNITESIPRSTPQSNVTSNSSFTSSKPSPSNDFPLEDPNSPTSDATSISTSDVSSISTSDVTPTSPPDVTPTSPSDVTPTSTSDVSSISTSDVTSTSPPDVTSISTSDVSSISTSDVTPTSPPDVTPTSPPDVTPTSPSDVTPTSTSDVSSISTSDVTSTSPPDVTSISTSDVSSISTSDVTPTSPPDVTPTSPPDVTPTSPSDVTPTSTSDVSSTSPPDVTSISTSDVSSISTSDVTPTSPPDVTPTSPPDVTPTSPSDVTPTSTSDVSSISTSDVTSTSPPDVTSISTSDVSSISTSDVTPTSPPDVTPTSPPDVTPTSPSDVTPTSTSDVSSTSPPDVTTTPSDVSSNSPSDFTSTQPSDVTSTTPSDVTTKSPTEPDTTSPPPSPTTTPTPSTLAPTPKWALDDDRKTLEWEATVTGTVIIEAEEGYKIAVKILECNIDGVNREYVIIGPGEVGKGVQFSYKVKRQPSYLFNTNVLYVEFYGTDASTFRANFSRIGEALTTTTTEITSSTQFLPTPSVNDSAVISVFVSGRRPTEYADKKVLDRFRDVVRKMATEYCFDQNFDLAEDITINNVNITRLMPCHSSWPGYETCAQITFAVPVYQKEDATTTPWQGYQLNSNHLSVMWNRYHKKYIDDDFSTFDVPDSSSWVKWQIIVFCSTTVIFLVVLLALKYLCLKFSRESKSDDMDAIIPISNEDDEVSLKPYYNQQLPPLFENTYQDITPGLSSIIVADVHDDLIESDDTDLPKIELTEEDLGESGA